MKAGTQAWFCYGNRTNEYLLINYGFAYSNNRYDSAKFYVRLDFNFMFENLDELKVADMLAQDEEMDDAKKQVVRLKRDQFNNVLISYIRCCLRESYQKKVNKILTLTRVYNLFFECDCLYFYEQLIKTLIQ